MKKLLAVVLGMIGVFCVFLGGVPASWLKQGDSVSVIGGSDGPTSVFIAGKIGDSVSIGLIMAGVAAIAAAVILFFKKKKY